MQDSTEKKPVKYCEAKFDMKCHGGPNGTKLEGDPTRMIKMYAAEGWTLRASFSRPSEKPGFVDGRTVYFWLTLIMYFEAPL